MSNPESDIILVVDDTPTNLAVLSEALSTAHYQVAVALDGETALEQVSYKPPHLILLDVMMPGIDGFETCRRLKANPDTADIPIIFTTALSDTVDKVKGLNLGAVDYITKPFEQEEVLARVKVHLELYHLNHRLESQVKERTAELSEALERLQQTQLQLVQNEKMSSLGQLVAGVAHEINNPVNFIHGNLIHAKEYITDLLTLLTLYQESTPEVNPEVREFADEIDVEFLKEDLPKLVKSMEVGAGRIQGIIASLKTFSRATDREFNETNVHEGIESTLLILSNRIKAKSFRPQIEVRRSYGELPLIDSFSGQLNQVFTNILSNAMDALDEAALSQNPGWQPYIEISTSVEREWVAIAISNNGGSIPPEIQEHLFDAFFTTKPPGKGTGMGLSISHQIITQTHGGRLSCEVEGDRVCFRIEIPIQQRLTPPAREPQTAID
ncbi:response regulator [Geitlerinema sp. P-1104]|uniref:sensor histidine kinase n=1 Tax=Geitlerinema sp. P-1104 TaxID=2546230 RepID=UPI001476BA4F|nr:response regulator [Geitlerinema sp. P-1104]NMG58868.1 response regulator [Geitlerinema sp. P-1104]